MVLPDRTMIFFCEYTAQNRMGREERSGVSLPFGYVLVSAPLSSLYHKASTMVYTPNIKEETRAHSHEVFSLLPTYRPTSWTYSAKKNMASSLREPSVLPLLKILFSLSVILIMADASTPKIGDKRVGFKKNVNIARQWTCKNPQPRLVYVGKSNRFIIYLFIFK